MLHVDICSGSIEVGDVPGLAIGLDGEGSTAVVREAGPVGFFDGVEFRGEVEDVGEGLEGDRRIGGCGQRSGGQRND